MKAGADRNAHSRGLATGEALVAVGSLALLAALGLGALGDAFAVGIAGATTGHAEVTPTFPAPTTPDARSGSELSPATPTAAVSIAAGVGRAMAGMARAADDLSDVDPAALRLAEAAVAERPGAVLWPYALRHHVNPKLDVGNCSACVHALDLTLEGKPASARPVFADAFRDGRDGLLLALAYDPARLDRAKTVMRRNYAFAARLRPEVDALLSEILGMIDALDPVKHDGHFLLGQLMPALLMADAAPFSDAPGLAHLLGRAESEWHFGEHIEDVLEHTMTWPDRAKGVVMVSSEDDIGHVFTVLRHNGRTHLVDGQGGIAYGAESFAPRLAGVLRTDDVPPHVDLDALGLPLPLSPTRLDDGPSTVDDVPPDYWANPEFVNPRPAGEPRALPENDAFAGHCPRDANCAKVAVTTDHLLGGGPPAQALRRFGPSATGEPESSRLGDVVRSLGPARSLRATRADGKRGPVVGELAAQARSWPDGAKGVAHLYWRDGSSHFVNVMRFGDELIFVDNQVRRTADLWHGKLTREVESAWLVRTEDIPEEMRARLGRWLATEPGQVVGYAPTGRRTR